MYSGNSTADWEVAKNFSTASARALHPDIKPFELPLIGIQPLQRSTPVLFRGVLPLQHLKERPASLYIPFSSFTFSYT